MTVTLDTYIVSTTVLNIEGNFHPGIKNGLKIYYWPDCAFALKPDALKCAEDILAQITKEVNDRLGFGQQKIRDLTSQEWA